MPAINHPPRPLGSSVLDAIGGTPTVKLEKLSTELDREIYVKLELLNPGGSHKVRIALAMVLAAENEGALRRGSGQTIIEPTGGNTGLGLAIVSAVLGYHLVLVIPDNYSPAKRRLLQAYGADVVLSDHRRGGNSHGERAIELLFENPDWVLLNQQANPANPEIHRATTAVEILGTFGEDNLPDAVVAGVGTGGHLTGVGQRLRSYRSEIHIAAVVPEGCSLKQNHFEIHHLQGLAVGLVPKILDVDLIDQEVPVKHTEAIEMMRRLMSTEGLGAGISSAANVVAATRIATELPAGAKVLTFAYDNVTDYLDQLS